MQSHQRTHGDVYGSVPYTPHVLYLTDTILLTVPDAIETNVHELIWLDMFIQAARLNADPRNGKKAL